jgi:hypothetical protein
MPRSRCCSERASTDVPGKVITSLAGGWVSVTRAPYAEKLSVPLSRMAGLSVELHADKGILLLSGPAGPGQFRPGGGVHRQQEVAVVGETLGTGADVAVHERGILAE